MAKGGGHPRQKEQFVQRCGGVEGYVLFRAVTNSMARVQGVERGVAVDGVESGAGAKVEGVWLPVQGAGGLSGHRRH